MHVLCRRADVYKVQRAVVAFAQFEMRGAATVSSGCLKRSAKHEIVDGLERPREKARQRSCCPRQFSLPGTATAQMLAVIAAPMLLHQSAYVKEALQ